MASGFGMRIFRILIRYVAFFCVLGLFLVKAMTNDIPIRIITIVKGSAAMISIFCRPAVPPK